MLNESVHSENADKATINTVDDLFTIRPNLTKKYRAESKKKVALLAQENYPDPPAMACASSEKLLSIPMVDGKDCSHRVGVNDDVVKSLTLTRLEAGRILGSDGCTVNDIRRASGARIDVLGGRFDKERKVQIRGMPYQVRKAFYIIQDILNNVKTIILSSAHIGAIMGEKGSIQGLI